MKLEMFLMEILAPLITTGVLLVFIYYMTRVPTTKENNSLSVHHTYMGKSGRHFRVTHDHDNPYEPLVYVWDPHYEDDPEEGLEEKPWEVDNKINPSVLPQVNQPYEPEPYRRSEPVVEYSDSNSASSSDYNNSDGD